MSTLEERVSALEEVQSDFVPPFKKLMVTMDQHTEKLDQHAVQKRRVAVSELRSNNMEENHTSTKVDMSLVRAEIASINKKMTQIVASQRPIEE
jgi:hypothetical protein